LKRPFQELESNEDHGKSASSFSSLFSSGSQLRDYCLAIGATCDYTSFHGGAVSQALSAIVTTIN